MLINSDEKPSLLNKICVILQLFKNKVKKQLKHASFHRNPRL